MNQGIPLTLTILFFQLALIILFTCLSMAHGAPYMVQQEGVDQALVKEQNREELAKEQSKEVLEVLEAFWGNDSGKKTDNEPGKQRVKRTIEPIIGQIAGSAVQIGVTLALQAKKALFLTLLPGLIFG